MTSTMELVAPGMSTMDLRGSDPSEARRDNSCWNRRTSGERVAAVWVMLLIVGGAMALTMVIMKHKQEKINPMEAELVIRHCDIAIVGGGLTGLYLANQLLNNNSGNSVCLLEKDSRLGGRILDHTFTNAPNTIVGLGDFAFGQNHTNMRSLMDQLNISYETVPVTSPTLLDTRGILSNTTFAGMDYLMKEAFPSLHQQNLTSETMYEQIFQSKDADDYFTPRSYVSKFYGSEGSDFLLSPAIFPGFVTSPGVREFLQVLKRTFEKDSPLIRPKEGLSAIIKALEESVKKGNGSILLQESVEMIEKSEEEEKVEWQITTNNHIVKAKKLIIAAAPVIVKTIKGDVMKTIQNHRIFKSLEAVNVVKCVGVYATTWWEKLLSDHQTLASPTQGLGEIYDYGGSVLQTVFSGHNVWWKLKDLGEEELNDAIQHALSQLSHPGIQAQKPLESKCQFWESGEWTSIKAGSPTTRHELVDWSIDPLPGHNHLYLAGAAYGLGPGQLEDALLSANHVLKEALGMTI